MAGQSLIIAERDVQATSLAAMRGTIYQAHYALSKHLRDDQQDYHDLSDDDQNAHMVEL